MGTGTLLALVDATDPFFPLAMYAVTILFVVTVWTRKLHFADVTDVGIINYLTFCSICVGLGVTLAAVLPLFYADPMGAIVGRNIASRKLVGSKSVAGTLAVVITAALTANEPTLAHACMSGIVIGCIEVFSGKWDNPCIGAWLLLRHVVNTVGK